MTTTSGNRGKSGKYPCQLPRETGANQVNIYSIHSQLPRETGANKCVDNYKNFHDMIYPEKLYLI